MATRRRTTARSTTASRTRKRASSFGARFTPEVVRSIVGLILLILGAMTFIALILPGQGSLTSWWTGVFAPWFGAMRWLLPFGLLAAGWYLETRQPKGWGLTLLGMAIAYAGVLGLAQILFANPEFPAGGRIGRFLESVLEPLLTAPGAVIVLFAMVVIGVMLAFNLRFAQLTAPITAVLAWLRTTTSEAVKRDPAAPGAQACHARRGERAVQGRGRGCERRQGPGGRRGAIRRPDRHLGPG